MKGQVRTVADRTPAMTAPPFDLRWLPTGHVWDLHIVRYRAPDAGSFTGGGWKLCWHTTESPWERVDAMQDVLVRKNAAPHFVIGGRAGLDHPVVIQMLPLDVAGRALQNDPSDGSQTNRANCIQVEICGVAAQMQNFDHLKALANLFGLIDHRRNISNTAPQDFSNPHRMTDREWVDAKGHVGHVMAPDNNHVDPGRLAEGTLIDLIDKLPEAGYPL